MPAKRALHIDYMMKAVPNIFAPSEDDTQITIDEKHTLALPRSLVSFLDSDRRAGRHGPGR